MPNNVIDKPALRVDTTQYLKPKPKLGERWEIILTFKFSFGSMKGRSVIDLIEINGQTSGHTELLMAGSGKTLPAWPTDFDGLLTKNSVNLNLWVNEPILAHTHFICSGESVSTYNKNQTSKYEGMWDMPCLKPKECNCQGDNGKFQMIRLT